MFWPPHSKNGVETTSVNQKVLSCLHFLEPLVLGAIGVRNELLFPCCFKHSFHRTLGSGVSLSMRQAQRVMSAVSATAFIQRINMEGINCVLRFSSVCYHPQKHNHHVFLQPTCSSWARSFPRNKTRTNAAQKALILPHVFWKRQTAQAPVLVTIKGSL